MPQTATATVPAPAPAPALSRSTKELAQDGLVMSTNSSSIVSKRSVERIYYPDEPHFFRFFVNKPQRRSPLINRGYHFRLHVIDVAVRHFLKRPSNNKKVVVNLGCGSDVLPWQCMTRYPEECSGAKFIDVDFPDLISKKRRIVQETPELHSVLTGLEYGDDQSDLLLTSNEYVQIGCDLRQLSRIQDALAKVVNIHECEFIFVAEVSITYMETEAADSVIQWASSLGHAEFCLLEQILPDGADHPFADMMLRHFNKLKTPIKSVNRYPTIQAQQRRFQRLGWVHADVQSLWSAWSSDRYLTTEDRLKLNEIEPFDEWEEFAIFASHYCIVSAHTRSGVLPICTNLPIDGPQNNLMPSLMVGTTFTECGKTCQRRFGAPMKIQDQFGREFLGNVCGLGSIRRLRSTDLYTSHPDDTSIDVLSAGPLSRMCHTMVDLGMHGHLLAGGRASPSSALRDCWKFDVAKRSWHKTANLPKPLYRHSATRLGRSSLALVIGGKTDATSVFKSCLLYQPDLGWTECNICGTDYVPVFGAILVSFPDPIAPESESGESTISFHGLLIGGLLEDGTIAKQALHWRLSLRGTVKPEIRFDVVSNLDDGRSTQNDGRFSDESTLYRFGASAAMSDDGKLLVIGGVVENRVVPRYQELLLISASNSKIQIYAAAPIIQPGATSHTVIPRPLLLGISVCATASGELVVMNGGATCFSFGTYWNKGTYSFRYHLPELSSPPQNTASPWRFQKSVEFSDVCGDSGHDAVAQAAKPDLVMIPRVQLKSRDSFAKLLSDGKPVVLQNLDIGNCVQTWTPEHLINCIGQDRKVVIHEASTAKMDFNAKNFSYVTKDFGSFVREVEQGRKMYLRALSDTNPTEKPANLDEDYPKLAGEFRLPDELTLVVENTFSSVLRISGPVNMWLHYDVMANVYCQIKGSKRLILFPPADVTKLAFAPGASSSSVDVFAALNGPSLVGTHPHEAILNPGDVLFLPPLWLHTAEPRTNLGVAVNVFFRNLESGYSTGRDLYGNRDLSAYEKGRQDVARIAGAFSKVPSDIREFYLRRLASELLLT